MENNEDFMKGWEIENIEYWESIAKEAIDEALKELYAKNISSVHGDEKGIYERKCMFQNIRWYI